MQSRMQSFPRSDEDELPAGAAAAGASHPRDRRSSTPDFTRLSRVLVDTTSRSLSGRRVRRQHRRQPRDSDALSDTFPSAAPDSWSSKTSPPTASYSRDIASQQPFQRIWGTSTEAQRARQSPPSAPAARALSFPVHRSLSPTDLPPGTTQFTTTSEPYDSDNECSDDFQDAASDMDAPTEASSLVHPLMRHSTNGYVYSQANSTSTHSGSQCPTISTDSKPPALSAPRGTESKPDPATTPAGIPSNSGGSETTKKYVAAKAAAAQMLQPSDVMQSDADLRADIEVARTAVHKFLNSDMLAAEALMKTKSHTSLYYALGAAIIQIFKAMMTFDHDDLLTAVSYSKDTMHIASLLRKPSSAAATFGRFVRGSGQSPAGMHAMSMLQRHAELVYAESTFLKAMMGILVSGDFLGFVSEALSMRNAYGIYRSLQKYLTWVEDEAAHGNTSPQAEVDQDFRSGVALGNGLINVFLGLLPSKVLTIVSCFGYTGSCSEGLRILMEPGGWTTATATPKVSIEEEGIRRPLVDMGILMYHLVIATFMPVQGVDVVTAQHILTYHLERYPRGVFLLYFSGRLYSTLVDPERAITQFARARDIQRDYLQLRHICVWDMALCSMSLGRWSAAAACYNTLLTESNWSKAVYMWGLGSTMYTHLESAHCQGADPIDTANAGNEDAIEETSVFVGSCSDRASALAKAKEFMSEAPEHMQRIAGKSIPLEKFVQKKAAKLQAQGYLLLPGLEYSYLYHCISHAPGSALAETHLPLVHAELMKFQGITAPETYSGGADAYWDDLCLIHFLHATINKHIAYPEEHALQPPPTQETQEKADKLAEESLLLVEAHAEDLKRDHYLAYFAQYELGRLYAARGQVNAAREKFLLVMSGKELDRGRKGKYAMQNMALLRAHGALALLPPA